MKVGLAIAIAASALTASCGKTDPDHRKPGAWKTDAELVRFELTGAPAGAEQQIAMLKEQTKAQMKNQLSREECVTAAQSARENISKDFLKGISSGGQCALTTDKVGGGKMDIAGNCQMGPSQFDITMKGINSSEKIDAVVTMKGGPAPGPKLDMEMKLAAKYTGECKN